MLMDTLPGQTPKLDEERLTERYPKYVSPFSLKIQIMQIFMKYILVNAKEIIEEM